MYVFNSSENSSFYATKWSAGFDICSNEAGVLNPGEFRIFKTGMTISSTDPQTHEIHEVYYENDHAQHRVALTLIEELQIRPRSGLAAKHGVTVLNSPGTVDADYPGEIGIILINHGKVPFEVKKGDRIAQGVVALVARARNVDVANVDRTGGFGSTNK